MRHPIQIILRGAANYNQSINFNKQRTEVRFNQELKIIYGPRLQFLSTQQSTGQTTFTGLLLALAEGWRLLAPARDF